MGLEVPEGATLFDMADLITHRMLVKATKSSITVPIGGVSATSAVLSLANPTSVSGSAFSREGNNIKIEHDTTITITVSGSAYVGHSGNYAHTYLRKNGQNIATHTSPVGSDKSAKDYTVTLSYSGKAVAGDLFSLYFSNGTSNWTGFRSGTITVNGTN